MSLTASIITTGVNSHLTTAEEANALATDILNPGVIGTTGNTSGVSPATGGFSVNAQGSPDTTIAISAGVCYVTATPTGGNSQKIRVKNSASANLTISANATGATRFDWIYVKIDPDKAVAPNVSATDVATLVSSRSTSATTDNGTPPTYGLLLAVVTVANGFSTITNGTIADKRTSPITGISSAGSFFALYDFVESGCVITADAVASTLAASMTTGYVWLSGVRLTVSAVTARLYTASKDTYVDASNNGDGTALLTYTEVTNNAASPAQTAGSLRLGIVVSGASSIAATTSINQGQESRVLPIASSIAYSVTDSLGNLICPRDPNRRTLGYRQIVANLATLSATSSAALTGLSVPVIVPTGRKIKVSLGGSDWQSAGALILDQYIYDTNTSGTLVAHNAKSFGGANAFDSFETDGIVTPASASKTYIAAYAVSTSSISLRATVSPAWIKVELV